MNTTSYIDCNNQNVKDHPIVALIFCSTMLIVCFLGCVFIPKWTVSPRKIAPVV